MRVSLIIAGGGGSARFKASLKKKSVLAQAQSKLFLPLDGQWVIERSLRAFESMPGISEVILTLPKAEIKTARKKLQPFPKLKVIAGGSSRAESVWNGIKASSKTSDWIMVHDGARPLVSRENIQRLISFAKGKKAVLLAKPVVATLKESFDGSTVHKTIDRKNIYEAETPQLVQKKLLVQAYKRNKNAFQATDEASLVEDLGVTVNVLPSTSWNPKITHFEDFLLAEAYLTKGKALRTGLGRDLHRLVEGRKLIIGGIHIPSDKGSLGHSDGDVLLHAISDAILGTIGQGDIGDWFSDKNQKLKGMDSSLILKKVLEKARSSGWMPDHVDSVIILEKPKLGNYKTKIARNLARLLNLPVEQVSVKAKTMEGLGPEGQGLALSCETIVTMKRSQ